MEADDSPFLKYKLYELMEKEVQCLRFVSQLLASDADRERVVQVQGLYQVMQEERSRIAALL